MDSTHRRFHICTTDLHNEFESRPSGGKNTVNREFYRDCPNEVWVSDLTYISTNTGWLYLGVIIDVHSRKVVGWSTDVEMTTDVYLSALEMALGRRDDVIGLIHHSDRGSQYCSHAVRSAPRCNGIDCSN